MRKKYALEYMMIRDGLAYQKQAVVDQVNATGALGCSSCTIEDAENFADSKR